MEGSEGNTNATHNLLSWKGFKPILGLLKGRSLDETQQPASSSPKPHTDELRHQPEQQQELGLGFFQWPHSIDPDPNLDSQTPPPPPPPPDDLDQQDTDEERQNQQIVCPELQTLQSINQELQNQQPISEEMRNQQLISKELQNQQIEIEELLFQQTINEELLQLILEETEKVREKGVDGEVDAEQAENEANPKGVGREVDADGDGTSDNDDSKGEEDTAAADDDNMTENEDDQTRNENVEERTATATGLKDGRTRRCNYPVRPGAEDCSFYMRTGACKFGSNCKFNHPARRKNQAAKEKVHDKEENSERPGQMECKYYLRSEGCKFGKACRNKHSRGKTPVAPIAEFNFLGLPIRPGEKECPFYMRNGSCKYGSNCRFNHPDPTAMGGAEAPPAYGNGGSVLLQSAPQPTMSSWLSPRALNETVPFVPMMFSPTHPSPIPEWNNYQAPLYPATEKSLPTPPALALSNLAETNFYANHRQPMLLDEFPERPGQPECTFFLKTGDCKYRSACKFHHPKSQIPRTSTCALSDKGLPLRPDQNICSHYNRYGICKFGPACKFDHPVNYGHSASSPVYGSSTTADGARLGGSENGSEDLIQQSV